MVDRSNNVVEPSVVVSNYYDNLARENGAHLYVGKGVEFRFPLGNTYGTLVKLTLDANISDEDVLHRASNLNVLVKTHDPKVAVRAFSELLTSYLPRDCGFVEANFDNGRWNDTKAYLESLGLKVPDIRQVAKFGVGLEFMAQFFERGDFGMMRHDRILPVYFEAGQNKSPDIYGRQRVKMKMDQDIFLITDGIKTGRNNMNGYSRILDRALGFS